LATLCPLLACAGDGDKELAENQLLDQLLLKARSEKVWLHPEWRVLMHYSSTLFTSKDKSLVDDEKFFLSKQGKYSPQSELEATLENLFAPSEDDNAAIACRFPARLAWLRKVLVIDSGAMPAYQCGDLNDWLQNLDADGLTLIFPVSVLNSPASMFGHTFLRLDRKALKKPDLLASTVNFSAHAEEGRGLSFAFNGLTGGYPGRFTLAPYYERVKAYSDIENRDIWEYELSYSPDEVNFILLHLWELLPTYFDYYFIDENCSYHLLALLEVAKPGLNLTKGFDWDATPADTVRAIVNAPGLLKDVKYRPSLRKNINARAEALDIEEQEIAKSLALGELTLNDEIFSSKTQASKMDVLELAAEYLAYLQATSNKGQDIFDVWSSGVGVDRQHKVFEDRQYLLLTERSKFSVELLPPLIKQPDYRPDEGHGGRRIGLRYGSVDSEEYVQFDFRWAYHDLYDPDNGFIKGAQLDFLKPSFRYYANNNFQLEGIDFVSIVSAPERNYFIQPFSWKASAALQRYHFDDDERSLLGDFKIGVGLSYQLAENTSAYYFANTQLTIGGELEHDAAVGLGVSAEMIYTITGKWKGGVYIDVLQFVEGVTQTSYKASGRLRFSLNKNSAFLLEFSEKREFSDSFFESQLSWQFYF